MKHKLFIRYIRIFPVFLSQTDLSCFPFFCHGQTGVWHAQTHQFPPLVARRPCQAFALWRGVRRMCSEFSQQRTQNINLFVMLLFRWFGCGGGKPKFGRRCRDSCRPPLTLSLMSVEPGLRHLRRGAVPQDNPSTEIHSRRWDQDEHPWCGMPVDRGSKRNSPVRASAPFSFCAACLFVTLFLLIQSLLAAMLTG